VSDRQLQLIVENKRGVHGRVATRLAEIASYYAVQLRICRGEQWVDCSSILDVLALALVEGSAIDLAATGERVEEALDAVVSLLTAQDDP
jgi:phosphocarrier protein HPr